MKKTVSRIGIDPQYLRKGRFKRMNFRLQALYFCLLQYVDHAGCWDIDLIDLEEELETEFDFDPIAFCCEYSEYENLEEIKNNYDCIDNIQDLENNTTIIPIHGTDRLIIQDF